MRDIHLGLQYKNFPKPDSGLISATVCSLSGQLPTEFCSDGTINLLFLEGTEPTHFCELHHPVIAPEPIDSTDRLDFEEPILSRPEESPIFQNR